MFSSLLIPFATVTMSVPEVIAAWALPVVLIALYMLHRFDMQGHISTLSNTLKQMADSQQRLGNELAQLKDVVEAVRKTSVENNEALLGALEELSVVEEEVEVTSAPAAITSTPASKSETKPVGEVSQEPEATAKKEAVPANIEASKDRFEEACQLLAKPEEDYPKNLLKARELFLAEKGGAHSKKIPTLLSETLFWLGELAVTKEDEEKYHGEGVEYGKESVAIEDSVEAHLWYAANMGAHGVARGIMSSLFYLGDIEKHGKRAIELDERFFHAAPLRLMGRFYDQCPGFPIGKGDKNKAIKMLERAVELGPDFLMNHYFLADVYLAKRKKREARAVLDKMLAVENYALMPSYMKGIQDLGRKLLKKC